MQGAGVRTVELTPRASVMIEAMRDIGYSFEAAVADIIDNSIAAKSTEIDIRFGWAADEPWIAIVDNGIGMLRDELLEAMRPGSRNPKLKRAKDDLGRFGLGLKTASFSQCRELIVVSLRGGSESCVCWDLDLVAKTDEWNVIELSSAAVEHLPCASAMSGQGTLVLWRKIDRLDVAGLGAQGHSALNELMDGVRQHVARVFHRFLAGELNLRKILIRLNGDPIEPHDPFFESSIATQKLPIEQIQVNGGLVTIQPFILPHHSKVSAKDYERLAGPEGYLRNQGFYIYRNRRLILWGSWFRLARQEELTKLARVRIDIPNDLDYQWSIDVRKSRAHPPLVVRNLLKRIIEQIRAGAKRPYTTRGKVVVESGIHAVWVRKFHNDRIEYFVNQEHPIVSELLSDLDVYARDRTRRVLSMLGQSFPAAVFFSDYANSPKQVEPPAPAVPLLVELAKTMGPVLAAQNEAAMRLTLGSMEPFGRYPDLLPEVIRRLKASA